MTQFVREGDNVTITCTTTNTAAMGWGSAEYIDDGGQRLEFSTDDPIGSIRTSPKEPTTFANLTNANGSTFIIESQLHVTVLANYSQFNVTCHNTGNSDVEVLTFIVGKIHTILEYTTV